MTTKKNKYRKTGKESKERKDRKNKKGGHKKGGTKNKTQKTHKKIVGPVLEKQQMKVKCAPKGNKEQKDYTCYDDEALYKLKQLWNARHPDALIKTNDTKQIWNELNNYLKNTCNKESCWLEQKFVDTKVARDLETESFAPESPKEWKLNPNEWLSSVEIMKVMKQYEKAYKCFDFIGPSPIDYDTHELYGECVWEELCHFNLEDEIKKGRFKIGIIFNLDPHYKGGSHWVSMFINIKKAQIFYFDSAGDKIPRQIKKFVNTVKKQGMALPAGQKIDFKFDQNYPVEHQYGDTECGVYAIYFIVHMLEDKHTADYFKTHVLKDEYMQQFRKVYFNEDL
uniref:Ubiquitin-like protease family profile domain-containing protein n=1 Tax=viral metagenome TaxID=1070528 RepID=A0A6C0CSU9_9ZZZZ